MTPIPTLPLRRKCRFRAMKRLQAHIELWQPGPGQGACVALENKQYCEKGAQGEAPWKVNSSSLLGWALPVNELTVWSLSSHSDISWELSCADVSDSQPFLPTSGILTKLVVSISDGKCFLWQHTYQLLPMLLPLWKGSHIFCMQLLTCSAH